MGGAKWEWRERAAWRISDAESEGREGSRRGGEKNSTGVVGSHGHFVKYTAAPDTHHPPLGPFNFTFGGRGRATPAGVGITFQLLLINLRKGFGEIPLLSRLTRLIN